VPAWWWTGFHPIGAEIHSSPCWCYSPTRN